MDPTDLMAKGNAAANTLLDIFKKEWFLNVLAWTVIVFELLALNDGRTVPAVLRSVLVDDLDWSVLSPIIDGAEHAFGVITGFEFFYLACVGSIYILGFWACAAFWTDGKRLPNTTIVEVAPLNITLRLMILVSVATLFSTVTMLFAVLLAAGLMYSLGAAAGARPRQRWGAFMFGLMTFGIFCFATLLTPFVLIVLAVGNALR